MDRALILKMFFVCPMFSRVGLKFQVDVFMYYIAPYCPPWVVKVYRINKSV